MSNVGDKSKFMKLIRGYGADKGKGDESLIKLALTLVEGASSGAFDNSFKVYNEDGTVAKDASGNELSWPDSRSVPKEYKGQAKDDAALAYEAFSEARAGKLQYSNASVGVQISKCRPFVKLGAHTTHDGPTFMKRVLDRAEQHKLAGTKLSNVYNSLTSLAGKQVKAQASLTDAEIDDALLAKDNAPLGPIEKLEDIYAKLRDLLEAEGGDALPDGSVEWVDRDAEPAKSVLEDTLHDIGAAINAVGGKIPPRSKAAEKAAAEAEAKAKAEADAQADAVLATFKAQGITPATLASLLARIASK